MRKGEEKKDSKKIAKLGFPEKDSNTKSSRNEGGLKVDKRLIHPFASISKKRGTRGTKITESLEKLVKEQKTVEFEKFKSDWLSNKRDVVKVENIHLLMSKEFIDFIFENQIKITTSSNLEDKTTVNYISDILSYFSEKIKNLNEEQHSISMVMKGNADEFALKMKSTIDELNENGFTSLKQKTDELNLRGIRTYRDKKWTKATVSRIVKRLEKLSIKKPPKPQ